MTKILIVESQLKICKKFLKCLQTQGFDAILAENAVVGIDQVKLDLPDVIITSELDNSDLVESLRTNPIAAIIPVICVIDNQANIRKAMEIGADDCIFESCTEEELLKAIAVRLERFTFLQKWCATQIKEKI